MAQRIRRSIAIANDHRLVEGFDGPDLDFRSQPDVPVIEEFEEFRRGMDDCGHFDCITGMAVRQLIVGDPGELSIFIGDGGAMGIADLLNLPKPPTAVMCCNDVAAIGALKTLSNRGLQAGSDIALIGFDNLTICRFTQPALSTIQFAPSEIAPLAFRALLDEIEGNNSKAIYEYKTKFVLRESTCAPKL